jgi:acyl carrier protein
MTAGCTTLSEAAVAAVVRQTLRDLTGQPDLPVEPGMSLRDLPHWDSIKQIEAIASGEEAFEVDVHFRDMDKIFTVADLVAAILRATPS